MQELAAIEMDVESKRITDVFHVFANCEDDYFSGLHVHGLNTSHLKKHGFANGLAFLQASRDWLKNNPFLRIVANATYKESKALCLNIYDANLSCWTDRQIETLTLLHCDVES